MVYVQVGFFLFFCNERFDAMKRGCDIMILQLLMIESGRFGQDLNTLAPPLDH